MGVRKLNVLVYTGTGTTAESVKHCMYTLRQLLSSNYAVIPISETTILKEPWAPACALLVVPGGADLGYCRVLNGEGNRRIGDYVGRGGSYLGLCAGGYYGSGRCEFEAGNKPLEVIGNRELAFFPGTCRGATFSGFEYKSERGARAVSISINKGAFEESLEAHTTSYFNGGGVFVDAQSINPDNVEVLATYDEPMDVDGGDGKAAIVICKVGSGKAMLTGPHPEFAPEKLSAQPAIPNYDALLEDLTKAKETRIAFFQACLRKLGLEVTATVPGVAPLSNLHLSAINNEAVTNQLSAWHEVIVNDGENEVIEGENDDFSIQGSETMWKTDELKNSLPKPKAEPGKRDTAEGKSKPSWVIIPHEREAPAPSSTPQFNHHLFFNMLKSYRAMEPKAENWGDLLLYGEVVTSTNSILEQNFKLISDVSTGFTFAATTQIAGRGRGNNAWIAPPGMLIFSTVINHPAFLVTRRPIVFLQYIAAIAIVEAIQSYHETYKDIPVKLKWPNDIYARDPTDSSRKDPWVKIGGILSQCNYFDGVYRVVVGVGINTNNPRPTTSISDLVGPDAPKPQVETLLARVLTKFEVVYKQFIREGFSQDLESRYYRHWLHTGQIITLQYTNCPSARVLGITRDWGLLKVEEIDIDGKPTGKIVSLQSDENSFDYFKGLIRRKI